MRVVLDKEDEPFGITACQMVLVMKLTTFAWNVYDGARPEEVCIVRAQTSATSCSFAVVGARCVAEQDGSKRIPKHSRVSGLCVRLACIHYPVASLMDIPQILLS